jgi:hypothetical protein
LRLGIALRVLLPIQRAAAKGVTCRGVRLRPQSALVWLRERTSPRVFLVALDRWLAADNATYLYSHTSHASPQDLLAFFELEGELAVAGYGF